MRNFFLSFIVTVSFFLMAFKVHEVVREWQEPVILDTRPAISVIMPKLEVPTVNIELKNHTSFLNKIGHYESSNNYLSVNRLGYMGRYQFHSSTLEAIGIITTRKKFLSSPTLQEQAMKKLLISNKRTLRRYIRKYNNKVVHGVYVTESGILAAAHLGGAGNVMKWFKNGVDFKDGNGTPITRYMKVFSGYELNL
jgi:hypothetical protein